MTDTFQWPPRARVDHIVALDRLWCDQAERRRFEAESGLPPVFTGIEMVRMSGDEDDVGYYLFWDEIARHFRAHYLDLWRPWAEAILDESAQVGFT